MELTNQEKINILLEQLQLPDEHQVYFENASLKRLDVFKQKKLWHFHIEINAILPLQIYQSFIITLQKTFQKLTNVVCTLYTKDKQINTETITDYWQYYLQNTILSPAYKDVVLHQVPTVENNKLVIQARNEAEAITIKRKLEHDFQQFCQKVAIPKFVLDVHVNDQQTNIQEFKQKQAVEDREMMLKTIQQREERDQKKKHAGKNQDFMVGYKINDDPVQMENIQEEERRMTVQGYVFDVDVRKLRSGRSLLIIKATDYTDSLTIKKFSRGEEDEEVFDQLEKGIWVKARGSIQTDMYSNQLTMMANDINEIKVDEKKRHSKRREKKE